MEPYNYKLIVYSCAVGRKNIHPDWLSADYESVKFILSYFFMAQITLWPLLTKVVQKTHLPSFSDIILEPQDIFVSSYYMA